MQFRVLDVSGVTPLAEEPLGTKYKFWFLDQSNCECLFKEGRPGTGENWAEKIACACADYLGVPHANYELAVYKDKQGVVSRALVARGARLIHGNEVLGEVTAGYFSESNYRSKEHTLGRVIAYLRLSEKKLAGPYSWPRTESIVTALDYFVGYLMFDALIANQDRHDTNWGILRDIDGNLYLSPSYDHGSSMGRNELDSKRTAILTTKDRGQQLEAYARKARSALYPNSAKGAKPYTTTQAFWTASRHAAAATNEWLARLQSLTEDRIEEIISRVPSEFMTTVAREFTAKLISLNRERLLLKNE